MAGDALEQYRRVIEEADRLQRAQDRAQGAWEQVLRDMQGYGCGTLEELEDKVAALRAEAQAAEEALEEALRAFEEVYGPLLGGK